MSGLISFLFRSGGNLLRESVEAYLGGVLVKRTIRRLIGALVVYALVGILALAALAFLYLLLYRWLSASLGDISAAGILCGGNLLVIAVILIVRALMRPRAALRSRASGGLLGELSAGIPGAGQADLEAGIAIGVEIGQRLRKSAPEIALAAGLIGLVIGVRPEILGVFRGKAKRTRDRRE